MRTVATLRDAPSAYVAASLLEAEGIACEIRDEHAVGVDWFLSLALGGVKLLVAEDGFARAAALLRADHSAAPGRGGASLRGVRLGERARAAQPAHRGSAEPRVRDSDRGSRGALRCRSCGHHWCARPEQTPRGTQNP